MQDFDGLVMKRNPLFKLLLICCEAPRLLLTQVTSYHFPACACRPRWLPDESCCTH